MKRILLAVGGVLLLVVLAVVALLAVTFMGRRGVVDGREIGNVRLVVDGMSTVGVVPVGDGEVLLVDAGQDAEGAAVLAELDRRQVGADAVRAVLITHGHQDHTGGLALFPRADVFALEAEVPLVEGRAGSRGPLTRLFPVRPTGVTVTRALRDNETIHTGDVLIRAFAVPGHTAGSAAYLIDGILFVGDSADVTDEGAMQGAPWIFSDSQAENRASLARLVERLEREGSHVSAIVPAHSGAVEGLAPLASLAREFVEDGHVTPSDPATEVVPHAYPRDGAAQLFDNDQVTVWDVVLQAGQPTPMHRHRYDLVGVDLADATARVMGPEGTTASGDAHVGQVLWVDAGVTHIEEGVGETPRHVIAVDLKTDPDPPLENTTGLADAWPRPGAQQVLDNDRVTVWDYTWTMGRPTPTHFHGRDTVVVYLADGELRSTTPDGESTTRTVSFGEARFSPRDRAHTEELIAGAARVIAIELK